MKLGLAPCLAVCLLPVLLPAAPTWAVETVLSDDFSGPLEQWLTFWGPSSDPSIATVLANAGRPAPCLELNDQLTNGAYAITKQPLHYVGRLLNISADMMQGNAAIGDQRNATLAINKTNTAPTIVGEYVATLGWEASTNPHEPGTAVCTVLYADNDEEKVEASNRIWIPNPDGWHNARIRLRVDGKVDFFVDGVLIYSSLHTVVPTYDGQAAVCLGGRKSLYDNVLVTSAPPQPCDIDGDGDVDQADYAIFQKCFSGPDVPGDPDCARLQRVNVPPQLGSIAIQPDLFQGEECTVTVTVRATDGDGTVQSVNATLATLGGQASQPLQAGTHDWWTWSGTLTPPNVGTQIVTVTATDNQGATKTLQIPVVVKPAHGSKKWEFKANDEVNAQAVGPDGTIYFGTQLNDGNLYAVNPDGSKKWELLIGGVIGRASVGPDGTIYVGSSIGPHPGVLWAINPDGTIKWSYETGDTHVTCATPVADDGTVYTKADNRMKLIALNPNGTLKWEYGPVGQGHSSPILGSDGTIYVGSGNGGTGLLAVNPDGALKWHFETNCAVHCTPALDADGTIYIGGENGKVYAVNPDGSSKWEFQTGGYTQWSAAIGLDGTIHIGSNDHKLYALRPDGTLKWIFTAGSTAHLVSVGADGTVFVSTCDGNLYALSPEDGLQKWTFATTPGNCVGYQSIIADGTLYLSSNDHNLYAINTWCGGLAPTPWPKWMHDNRNSGRPGAH